MASSFGEAFAKSFQSEMARRRDAEAEIAREQRLEERAGRERALRIAEGIESEQRQNAAALSMFKEQGVIRSAQATADREATEAEDTLGISQQIPYNIPFDARANIASQRRQLKDWEAISAENILRKQAGLEPLPPSKPTFVSTETEQEGQEFRGLGGGGGEWVPGEITPPSGEQIAERVEAARTKKFADDQSEKARAANLESGILAGISDKQAFQGRHELDPEGQKFVDEEYAKLGEAPGVGVYAAIFRRAKAEMHERQAQSRAIEKEVREKKESIKENYNRLMKPHLKAPLSAEQLRNLTEDDYKDFTSRFKRVRRQVLDPANPFESVISTDWVPIESEAPAPRDAGRKPMPGAEVLRFKGGVSAVQLEPSPKPTPTYIPPR